jgi:hypothetical protein
MKLAVLKEFNKFSTIFCDLDGCIGEQPLALDVYQNCNIISFSQSQLKIISVDEINKKIRR